MDRQDFDFLAWVCNTQLFPREFEKRILELGCPPVTAHVLSRSKALGQKDIVGFYWEMIKDRPTHERIFDKFLKDCLARYPAAKTIRQADTEELNRGFF